MLYALLALLGFAWLIVLIVNVVRIVQVMRLEPGEAPKTTAWVAWGISAASLVTGGCVALIGFAVIEWILPPVDPFEDSLGTVQLFTRARSNVGFTLVGSIIAGILVAMMFPAMQAMMPDTTVVDVPAPAIEAPAPAPEVAPAPEAAPQ